VRAPTKGMILSANYFLSQAEILTAGDLFAPCFMPRIIVCTWGFCTMKL
jgi:hypothetical protein